MVVSEILSGVDNSVHICLHQVCDDVDILKPCSSRWSLNIKQSNDIFMVKELYKYQIIGTYSAALFL